jgi:ribonuclease Z
VQITFLGTAGSWPTKDRNASAIALDMDSELLLLDCGEGTQRQFFQSRTSFMRVRRIFLTHFHGDHFLGLPGLLQSMNLNNRQEPLDIYGPVRTKDFLDMILGLGYFTQKFPVEGHEVAPGEVLHFGSYTVRAARARHPVPALAWRIEEKPKRGRFDEAKCREWGIRGPDFARLERGEPVERAGRSVLPEMVMGPPRRGRSIVYTGDTSPVPEIEALAEEADVLIHEATVGRELESEANDWGHSSARQAAEVALRARVGRLYLTHFSSRYPDTGPLEAEAREIFPATEASRDLLEHLLRQR